MLGERMFDQGGKGADEDVAAAVFAIRFAAGSFVAIPIFANVMFLSDGCIAAGSRSF